MKPRDILLLGPVVDAPPDTRRRATLDWGVTLVAATAPMLLAFLIAPAFGGLGKSAGDLFGGIKHGELFVATSSLVAPILSVIVRREWPSEIRSTASIISCSLIALVLSIGFFFALLANPELYSNLYVIVMSFVTFALGALALISFNCQGMPPPEIHTPPTEKQEKEQKTLADELSELRGQRK
jgi:hypothetical protein